MKKITKFNFRTLIVLFLSIALCLSTALSVACDNNDNSSSSSSSSSTEETVYPTDAQTVLNGDFEFSTFTKDADDFPVASSISWVRSSDSITSSAVSSSYTSGIIDTNADVLKEYASAAGLPVISKEDTELEFYNPLTPYDFGLITDEDSFIYDEEDNSENEDGKPMKGSKILMIHNEVKSSIGEGTAQKFTSSSSLKLAKHEFAKLSVWVKTHNLKSAYYDNGEFGAYIAIQNTVSSSTTPFVIKNINTNGQWAKYTVYLSSSDFATSSFKVVLGLGFGSKEIRRDYVEGFAFFDNANFEIIDKAAFESGINGVTEYNLYDSNNAVKETLESDENGQTYADNALTGEGAVKFTEKTFLLSHTRADASLSGITLNGGTTTNNKYDSVANQVDGTVNHGALSSILDTVNTGASEEDKVLAPVEGGNALHIAHTSPTSTSYETSKFTLGANKYLKLSFWVKAQTKYPSDTALTVTLNDLGTGSAEAVETVIASNVNTNDYENANYNDWMEYVLYLSNTVSDVDRVFTLTFDFGTTATTITNGVWDLTEGYAIVTDPVGYELSEDDYNIADTSTYTYAKKVSLSADLPNGVEDSEESKDSYTFTHGNNDNNVIKTGVATNVVTYKGVVGGSTYVGGATPTLYKDDSVVAGIVNSQYATAYGSDIESALNGLGKLGTNKYVQPLMIKTTDGGKTFGYVGSSSSIAAASTVVISVKVKVVGDAEAYIYLTNSNALDSFNILGVDAQGKKVENGELVNDGDPLKKDFVVKVTAADMIESALDEGWLTVNIVVTAGDNALPYRVELWNGARDGETTARAGIVLFDGYKVGTATNNKAIIDELKIDYNEDPTVTSFTRVPTLISYTDDDGNDVSEYRTYEATNIIYEFATSKSLIVDLTTIDAVTEIDNTTSDSDDSTTDSSSSDETSSNETSFSWALQITSIIIAAVLILLLIVVLIKMLYDKYGKKKNSSKDYYNRNSRERAGLEIEAKNARKAKEAEKVTEEEPEEVQPYDYDNMENNIVEEPSEETTEEVVEESTEEVNSDEDEGDKE